MSEKRYQVRFQLTSELTKHPFRVGTRRHGIGESVPMGSIAAMGTDTHLSIEEVRELVCFINNNRTGRFVKGCENISVVKIEEHEHEG